MLVICSLTKSFSARNDSTFNKIDINGVNLRPKQKSAEAITLFDELHEEK
jgi:hypothetical protein